MITDYRAAQLCAALYDLPSPASVIFSHVDPGLDDGIFWAIAREGDTDVIVLRGSVTPGDWFRDSMAKPSYLSRRLGPVHTGFYLGMDNAWADMSMLLRHDAPVAVVGHSLGAGRAAILTGIMIDAGRPPAARISFGEPKPGFAQLASFVAEVPAKNYRNTGTSGHDVVTDLPFTIPEFGLNYVHSAPLIDVSGPPDPTDTSGLFVFHHMPLYVKALSSKENV